MMANFKLPSNATGSVAFVFHDTPSGTVMSLTGAPTAYIGPTPLLLPILISLNPLVLTQDTTGGLSGKSQSQKDTPNLVLHLAFHNIFLSVLHMHCTINLRALRLCKLSLEGSDFP